MLLRGLLLGLLLVVREECLLVVGVRAGCVALHGGGARPQLVWAAARCCLLRLLLLGEVPPRCRHGAQPLGRGRALGVLARRRHAFGGCWLHVVVACRGWAVGGR